MRRPPHEQALAALPDATSAAVFMALWIAPLALGESGVRNAMLVMLVEFVLVHASGFLGVCAFAADTSRSRRRVLLGGFSVLYLVFIAMFATWFQAGWPFLAFGWLLLGKLAIVHGADAGSSRAARASSRAWAMSGIAYVSSLVVTALMPLPRLGFGDAVLSQLGLPGSGAWVEQPQRAVAAGVLYFGMLAWFKWVAAREPAAT